MQCFDNESNSSKIVQNKDIQLSIIVVGESGVGKSSLCKRFTGENKSVSGPTVIASSWQKTTVVHGVKVKLLICDTGGQEAFRDHITSYFDKKDGVIFVYDVTNKNSFQKLSCWLDLVRKYNNDFVSLIVGNKSDYSNEKSVASGDGAKFAKENGLTHMETSAKNGNNVDKVFEYLVLKLFLKKEILPDDKLNVSLSSAVLLYESPVLKNYSLNRQNWVDNVSEHSFDHVHEEVPSRIQNIPVIADSQGTPTSSELPSRPPLSHDDAEPISNTSVTERINEDDTAILSSAVTERTEESKEESSDFESSTESCNELPPIVPLTNDEIVELYVQRQRRLSTNSLSSLANWDSSIVAEYEDAIKQYEEARAEVEAARKKPKSDCTLL